MIMYCLGAGLECGSLSGTEPVLGCMGLPIKTTLASPMRNWVLALLLMGQSGQESWG